MQSINHDFANHSKGDEIFPITVKEIAEGMLRALVKAGKYETLLVENITVLCKDGKEVIPKSLQRQVVQWYHHYLQHPGHTCLEETLFTAMNWKSMRTLI